MTTYVSNRNGDGLTDEQGHYRFQTKVWLGNVISGLAVTENSPLARNVLVPVGDLKIDYGDYSYTAWNDAAVTVSLATADTTNPRIDRIIAYIDRALTTGGTNNPGYLKFVAVAGTPGAVPAKASDATVNAAIGASNPWCEIATVRVEANATTIANAKITDTRVMITVPNNSVPAAALKAGIVDNTKLSITPGDLGGDWVAFTPSWTGITLGNATNVGYYTRIGKTIIFRVYLLLGSTSSVTALIKLAPPVTTANYVGGFPIIGGAIAWASGIYPLILSWESATSIILLAESSSATYVSHVSTSATVPFTFAPGNIITADGTYQAV